MTMQLETRWVQRKTRWMARNITDYQDEWECIRFIERWCCPDEADEAESGLARWGG